MHVQDGCTLLISVLRLCRSAVYTLAQISTTVKIRHSFESVYWHTLIAVFFK